MLSIALLLGVDTEYGDALGMPPRVQFVDMAKLLVALARVDVAADQLLAQATATIAGSIQELRGGVAANLESTAEHSSWVG